MINDNGNADVSFLFCHRRGREGAQRPIGIDFDGNLNEEEADDAGVFDHTESGRNEAPAGAMAHNYLVTAHHPTAVTACATGSYRPRQKQKRALPSYVVVLS